MAVAARDPVRAAAFADHHGIEHVLAQYVDVLHAADIDAIYIALPTSLHFDWSKQALQSGKHVLCEKPVSMQASEVEELIALRDHTGKLCAEAFMVAHHPQWSYVRDNEDPSALKNDRALGGGGVRDIGVYPVVTTRLATGLEPHCVHATVEIDPRFGTDRFASARIAFPGFDLRFYCATQLARRQQMTFHGTRGWLALDAPFNPGVYGQADVHLRTDERASIETKTFDGFDQYQLMVEDFAEVVLGKRPTPRFTLENSLGNQRVIDQILR
ncbi:Gfo/Idh/MocA family oxidoreductase [Paraburkholderia sp. JHI2823]|uniref:Gfo/Idh/MocA family protein n=1 Tax=Paraburkholderia sp. JHI2823 TaxID=3112960 RepID=UPI00317511FE